MDRDLVPVEGKVSAERKTRIFMMRKSEAQIQANLTNAMKDAWMEIEEAFRYISGALGYGIHDLNHVSGLPEHEQEHALKIVQSYRRWASKCPEKFKGVVIDMTVFSFSPDEVAFQRSIDKKTVMARFRQGLNEYCILAGWGDQINTQPHAPKPR